MRICSLVVLPVVAFVPFGFAVAAVGTHDHDAADAKPTPAAQGVQQASVGLEKKLVEDEGELLIARVASEGKPLEGATVSFCVPRLFGCMKLGEADTNDEGLAAIRFPQGLPGDAASGDLHVTAQLIKPTTYVGSMSLTVPGGATLATRDNPFPRAIWSPKTDWHLLLTIPVLLVCVWSVYAFSIAQFVKIRRMRRPS
jgi:hypothetical protein